MTIKFLGIAPGAGEMGTEVWVFDKVFGVYPEDIFQALKAAGIWSNIWKVTYNKIYVEMYDFVTFDQVETAFKDYGL